MSNQTTSSYTASSPLQTHVHSKQLIPHTADRLMRVSVNVCILVGGNRYMCFQCRQEVGAWSVRADTAHKEGEGYEEMAKAKDHVL